MFMNGPMHPGRSPYEGPQNNHLAWQLDSQTNYGGAAIGRDGTIYQGTDLHELLAVAPDGVVEWTIPTTRAVGVTPAILPDGRIVFVDEGGTVYAANPDGTISWAEDTGEGLGTSPAIGQDGTIYLTAGARVYAFHPDGTIRWTFQLEGTAYNGVAVRPDGVVYVVTGGLYAIAADGSLLWRNNDLFLGGVSIGSDGTIYAASNLPTLKAYRPDGSLKWTYRAGGCCAVGKASTPALAKDGTIYVGMNINGTGAMLALSPDGALRWHTSYGMEPTAPLIDRDGTIYYGGGSSAASLFALNADGSLKWQYDTSDGYVRTPAAIGTHHRLYAGGSGGIYAIGPG